MHFDFRKMRSTIVVLFVFICMTTFYVTMADDNQCMCNCCRGTDCKMIPQMFTIDGCTSEKCAAQCPTHFPDDCSGPAVTKVEGMCMSR